MTTIKRIIFDLDDTLIIWKKEYIKALQQAIEEYKIPYDAETIDNTTLDYEKYYSKYTIENFLNHTKINHNLELTQEFLEKWLENLEKMSEENPEISDVLSYLSKKYELVVLTNWFQESQKKRLENARMSQYFLEIYGGDKYIKPDINSFKTAIGNHKPEECLMVGDNFKIDYQGALNAGLKAIYLSSKEHNPNIKTIKNLKELKQIL